jgi:protein subunit release factor A
LSNHSSSFWCIFDFPEKIIELEQLEKRSEDTSLWDDHQEALKIMKKLADLRTEIESWHALQKRTQDTLELVELGDESLRPELEPEVNALEAEIAKTGINHETIRPLR